MEVEAPEEFAGSLMGDLNGRRGRVQGMESRSGGTVIKAGVPLEPPPPPGRMPTCSGPLCSRTSLPPIVANPTPVPHPDICDGTPVDPLFDRHFVSRIEQPDELDPIGRVTEVERPPCRPSSAE